MLAKANQGEIKTDNTNAAADFEMKIEELRAKKIEMEKEIELKLKDKVEHDASEIKWKMFIGSMLGKIYGRDTDMETRQDDVIFIL